MKYQENDFLDYFFIRWIVYNKLSILHFYFSREMKKIS